MTSDRESQFDDLAPYYDALMNSVPYAMWVEYLEALIKLNGLTPKTVLDVACGTGNVSEILAERGYQVTGIDNAPGMIEAAKAKHGLAEYFVQDLTTLDLGRQFDIALSLFDSLNYVLDPNALAQGFVRIFAHLKPGSLFIFDVNTIYALANCFFDQSDMNEHSNPRYVWKSEWDPVTSICTVRMVFETTAADGTVSVFREVHRQRAYELSELAGMLEDAGFREVTMYHAYDFRRPSKRSDRVFFIARKVGRNE